MSVWLIPRIELTPEQLNIVELPINQNKVIIGPPGSGKTQILVHRAAYLAEKLNLTKNQYRVFVFTNVVKEYIKSGVQFLGLPEDVVSTFDHWCRLIYEKHISYRLPRDGKQIDFANIRLEVLELLKNKKDLQKNLTFILVDEGQDLSPETYEIISLSAQHITVFMDPHQKIFEEGAPEEFILKKLGLNKSSAHILHAYRNSPYIAKLASYFIDSIENRKQYLSQIMTYQKIKEKPTCYIASNFDDELDNLVEIVNQRQVMNEKIGIIVPTNKQLYGFTHGLEERGLTLEKAVASRKKINYNFNNDTPKIATYYSAKGLTFDSVLLPRLTISSFSWINEDMRKRLLFVGIARATQWVYLSTVKGKEFQEFQILKNAAKNNDLIIKEKEAFIPDNQQTFDDDDVSVL